MVEYGRPDTADADFILFDVAAESVPANVRQSMGELASLHPKAEDSLGSRHG
jgi:hypothetical protein